MVHVKIYKRLFNMYTLCWVVFLMKLHIATGNAYLNSSLYTNSDLRDLNGEAENVKSRNRRDLSKYYTEATGLTKLGKDAMLAHHNKLRRSEGASDMLKMTWDTELETKAQEHANKCKWGHSTQKSRLPPIRPSYVGENIAGSSNKREVTWSVQAWYDE